MPAPILSIFSKAYDISSGPKLFLGRFEERGPDAEDNYAEWYTGVLDGNFGRDAWHLEDGDRGCSLVVETETNRIVGYLDEVIERAAAPVLAAPVEIRRAA